MRSCCLLLAPRRVLGADRNAATMTVVGVVQRVWGALAGQLQQPRQSGCVMVQRLALAPPRSPPLMCCHFPCSKEHWLLADSRNSFVVQKHLCLVQLPHPEAAPLGALDPPQQREPHVPEQRLSHHLSCAGVNLHLGKWQKAHQRREPMLERASWLLLHCPAHLASMMHASAQPRPSKVPLSAQLFQACLLLLHLLLLRLAPLAAALRVAAQAQPNQVHLSAQKFRRRACSDQLLMSQAQKVDTGVATGSVLLPKVVVRWLCCWKLVQGFGIAHHFFDPKALQICPHQFALSNHTQTWFALLYHMLAQICLLGKTAPLDRGLVELDALPLGHLYQIHCMLAEGFLMREAAAVALGLWLVELGALAIAHLCQIHGM